LGGRVFGGSTVVVKNCPTTNSAGSDPDISDVFGSVPFNTIDIAGSGIVYS